MLKTTALTLLFGIGVVGGAYAAMPAVTEQSTAPIVNVGEGCGANHWRDHNGNCHPFGGPGGNNRGTVIECPPGTHIGPGHERCWPNQ